MFIWAIYQKTKNIVQKHKSYIDNLIKKYNEEEKNLIKDRPTIDKQSEKIAKMKSNGIKIYIWNYLKTIMIKKIKSGKNLEKYI